MTYEVLFFPSKENEQKIIDFISEAKKELKICVFTFTNKNIAEAILNKVTKEKVKVRIITDDVQNASIYSIVNVLQSASDDLIKFRTDLRKDAHMHHKYVVIDDKLIATGSFNWTQAAVTKNNENLLMIRDEKLAKQYSQNFEELWANFVSTEMTISQLSSTIKEKGQALKIRCATPVSKKQIKKRLKKDDVALEENGFFKRYFSFGCSKSENDSLSSQKINGNGKIKKGIKKDSKDNKKRPRKLIKLSELIQNKSQINPPPSSTDKLKQQMTGIIPFAVGAVSLISGYVLSSYLPNLF